MGLNVDHAISGSDVVVPHKGYNNNSLVKHQDNIVMSGMSMNNNNGEE